MGTLSRAAAGTFAALLVGAAVFAGTAAAAPAFDRSFGNHGVAFAGAPASAVANAMLVQSDGKIALTGSAGPSSLLVARLGANGAPDTTFGTSGVKTLSLDGTTRGFGIVQQSDGKLVVAGAGPNGAAFARFTTAGALDASYGTGGSTEVSPGRNAVARSLLLQPDGKVVGVGDASTSEPHEIVLIRLGTNGTTDATFGSNGVVETTLSSSVFALASTLQANGKIVVAGREGGAGGLVLRYGANGVLDSGFGTAGATTVGSVAEFCSVAVDSVGRIVAAGRSTTNQLVVARLTLSGSLDPGFGTGGIANTSLQATPTTDGSACGLVLQSDGSILVSGEPGESNGTYSVARFTSAGVLDDGFGSSGVETIRVSGSGMPHALTLQGSDAILVAGDSNGNGSLDAAVVRLVTPPSGPFAVDTTADTGDAEPGDGLCQDADGDCSLRAAVMEANALGGTHEVTVPSGRYFLNGGSGELDVAAGRTLHVLGAGASSVTVDASEHRGFHVETGATLSLVGLGIENGGCQDRRGGGAILNAGTAVLDHVALVRNGCGDGGALDNEGGIAVRDTTFADNNAVIGGGFENSGSAVVTDSTFTGNDASDGGGGLVNTGDLSLTNVTFAGNTAGHDGGAAILARRGTTIVQNATLIDNSVTGSTGAIFGDGGTVRLQNTLFARNTRSGSTTNCSGPRLASLGNNLEDVNSCSRADSDRVVADPLVGPLADNGGSVLTAALLTGSRAIDPPFDAGAACPATDARGVTRPQGATCDIGAFELEATPPANRPPVASFSLATTSGSLVVTVDGSGSTDPDGSIASYRWDFGDGLSGTGATATHTYAAAGTYTITLTVTDDHGATGSVAHSVTLTAPTPAPAPPPPPPPLPVEIPPVTPPVVVPNHPPVAVVEHTIRGLVVRFDGRASFDSDGRIVAYAWTFGDATRAGGATVVHHYLKAGHYVATLTVTDDDGATSTARIGVTVRPSTVAIDIAETIAVGDSATTAAPASINIVEPVVVGGANAVLPSALIVVRESLLLGDLTAVVPPAHVTANEGIAAGQSATVTPPANVSTNEGITAGQSATVTPPANVTTNEGIAAGQSATVTPPASIDVREKVGIGDGGGPARPGAQVQSAFTAPISTKHSRKGGH